MRNIEYVITTEVHSQVKTRLVWYYRGNARRLCAKIYKRDSNYLKIRISDSNAMRLEGEPGEVMGNIRIPSNALRLFVAAMVLEMPGESFAPAFLAFGLFN